jgi:hypothetical protein
VKNESSRSHIRGVLHRPKWLRTKHNEDDAYKGEIMNISKEDLMAKSITTQPMTAISGTAARLSLAAAAAFVVLLAALHVVKPEIDPSWRFISEYSIGRHGWIMVLAFLSLALSYVTLFIAIRSQIQTIAGRIGLALLLVSAVGLTLAGIFTTDPITASHDALTTSGNLHNLGGTLGIAMPFAAALVSWSLARNQAWSSARRPLLWAAGIALVGFLVAVVSLVVMLSQSNGTFGPDVLVGWPTRLEILTYCVWLMVVAWQLIQLRRQQS